MTAAALVISLVLLLVAAALRAGGASLVRTPRADALHDAAEGDPRAARVAELLEDRPRLQPAMGIVHTALMVAAAIPATWAVTELTSGWGTAVSLVLLGFVLVGFGDFLPRSWGRSRPRTLAYRFGRLVGASVDLGGRAADLLLDDEDEEDEDTRDSHDEEERELISSVLDFTDSIVREVMVPRTDMDTVPSSADAEEARRLVMAAGRSRIPVTGEGLDDIVGILYAKDLLPLVDESDRHRRVADIMRPASFVPETKRVSELLREMQVNHLHMAVCVDEFGGTAGLVTIEDIIEELVGEIVDEYDVEEPMVMELDGGDYLVDARMNVDDFGDLIAVEVPDEEWDTVGGLVLGLAGRVPEEGESFEFDGYVLTAARMQGRRISHVRITSR
jgi:CBS domain containing-hemolysin-like protein